MKLAHRWSTFQLLCYAIGYVFITSGIMKLLVNDFKGLFYSLGLPFPSATLFLVAIVEIGCGALIAGKMYVKQAAIPLMIIMFAAIFLTKVPILTDRGFLQFAFESRLDVIMLILLLLVWQQGHGGK